MAELLRISPENTVTEKFVSIFLKLFGRSFKRKPVLFSGRPSSNNVDYPAERGSLMLQPENLLLKYIITRNKQPGYDSQDFIIFLHGIGRNENQWLEKNGFADSFYKIAGSYPDFKTRTVVSVSLGMSYLLLDYFPKPFDVNMEELFTNKIVNYFRMKLNKYGNIYLIGHSMGGYNALITGLKHPELFPIVFSISPFISYHSPFRNDFIEKNMQLKKYRFWGSMIRDMLIYAFRTDENWDKYDPFKMIKQNSSFPHLILTRSKNDLPGFCQNIEAFKKALYSENIVFDYFITKNDHHRPDLGEAFDKFIQKIIEIGH